MLLALVFRGVAFEFRYRDSEHRTFWDHGFCCGSLIATFCAGHRARRLHPGLRGRRPRLRRLELCDCFTPFSILTGVALVFGYGLLGAGWLIMKTEGELQAQMRALRSASAWSEWSRRSASSASGRR